MSYTENQLSDFIEFSSPDSFLTVVEDLKKFVSNGTLIVTKENCSLFEIKKGHWPVDLIDIEFESKPSAHKYRLTCNTYHGAGGTFERQQS